MNIIDGAALMYTLDPKKSNISVNTFGDFSQLVFLPYVERQLQSVKRLDFVWDIYKAGSLSHLPGSAVEWVKLFELQPVQDCRPTGKPFFGLIRTKLGSSTI